MKIPFFNCGETKKDATPVEIEEGEGEMEAESESSMDGQSIENDSICQALKYEWRNATGKQKSDVVIISICLFMMLLLLIPDPSPTVQYEFPSTMYESYIDRSHYAREAELRYHIRGLKYAVALPESLKNNVTRLFEYYEKENIRRKEEIKEMIKAHEEWMEMAISGAPTELVKYAAAGKGDSFVWIRRLIAYIQKST